MLVRSVLITGAAGGLGAALARRLAAEAGHIVVVGRDLGRLRAVAATVGPHCEAYEADLCDAAQVRALCHKFAAVDAVVHCAGVGYAGQTLALGEDKLAETIDLNCRASAQLNYLFAEVMRRRGAGQIVNVSSLAGGQPMPYFNAYAASKAFLTAFSQALAFELRGSGVQVKTYCPGGIATRFHAKAGLTDGVVDDHRRFVATPEAAAADIARLLLKPASRPLVPGAVNKLLYLASRLMPRSVLIKSSSTFYAQYVRPSEGGA